MSGSREEAFLRALQEAYDGNSDSPGFDEAVLFKSGAKWMLDQFRMCESCRNLRTMGCSEGDYCEWEPIEGLI